MSFDAVQANKLSTLNSRSSANLAAGAVFQGVGEEVTQYGRVAVSIISANATDGILTMETSQDGISYNGAIRTWADTTTAAPHMWNVTKKYFRIKYTNGTTAATDLAIQVQYSNNASVILGQQLDSTLKDETEALIVKSIIAGSKPSGGYSNVSLDDSGALQVSNYGTEVSRSNLTGKAGVRIIGSQSNVGTTEQVIWNGGAAYNFLTAAATIRIKAGGNANDTAAGSGAREITVKGLDSTGLEITENIATNGASVSTATTQSFVRINSFCVTSAGTYASGAATTGSNAGVISIETSGGLLLGAMAANSGAGTVGVYSVPTGKKGYFQRLRITPEGSKSVTFRLWTRKLLTTTSGSVAPKELRAEWILIASEGGFQLDYPFELDELEEVWVTAKTSSGTSAASCAFEIELIDD